MRNDHRKNMNLYLRLINGLTKQQDREEIVLIILSIINDSERSQLKDLILNYNKVKFEKLISQITIKYLVQQSQKFISGNINKDGELLFEGLAATIN